MGSAAAAELFRRTVLYTDAKSDSEHLGICVLNDPLIPDRSEYILSLGSDTDSPRKSKLRTLTDFYKKTRFDAPPSPLKSIRRHIREAKKLHCRFFAVACNTAHYFYTEYEKIRGIRFINMVKETCRYAEHLYRDKTLCVLATPGTVKADIYGRLSPSGARLRYPSAPAAEAVSELIRRIKEGENALSHSVNAVEKLLTSEFDTEKTVFLLACTELSLISGYFNALTVIDSTDVLAAKAVTLCGKRLNRSVFNGDADFFERYI